MRSSLFLFCLCLLLSYSISTVPGANNSKSSYTESASAQASVSLLEEILQKVHNMPQMALRSFREQIVSQNQTQVLANNYTPPSDGFGAANYKCQLEQATSKPLPAYSPVRKKAPALSSRDFDYKSGKIGTLDKYSENVPSSANTNQTIYENRKQQSLSMAGSLVPTIPVKNSKAVRGYLLKDAQQKQLVLQPLAGSLTAAKMPALDEVAAESDTIAPRLKAELANEQPSKSDIRASNKSAPLVLHKPQLFQRSNHPIVLGKGLYPYSSCCRAYGGAVGAGAPSGTGALGAGANIGSANLKPAPKTRDMDVALLPPPIVTGVSSIRLGDTKEAAIKTITALKDCQLKKESVHDWSVISVLKAKSKLCSMQVFLRQGKVEAIRVFDSSFLQTDLGINFTDGLSKVKEKFGEPTFILRENTTTVYQNYIYPLSQVGFELTRSKIDKLPQITSMIIFNMK